MNLTKASVYIRTVGSIDSSAAFIVPSGSNVAFSAANFSYLSQDENYIIFNPNISGSLHAGCMEVGQSGTSQQFGYMTYPIKASAGKHYIYLRIKKNGGQNTFHLNCFIDGIYQKTTENLVVDDAWQWISTDLIFKKMTKNRYYFTANYRKLLH
jgi:hypothetical protein